MTVGAIEDSRLSGGTLTVDAQPFAKQMTSVTLSPSVDTEGDRVETLSGATIEPDEVTRWQLDLGAIQDFDDPAGFVEFCRANAGEVVSFSWAPNAVGPTYAGTLRVRAVAIGGDVASRLNTPAAFPVVTLDDPTYPAP
jgi:hypothetical protein